MRKHPREIQAPATAPSPYLRAASLLLSIGIIAVSTAISTGTVDAFRLPKEIVFRAEAILIVALAVFAATERNGRWRDLVRGIPRRELLLCAAILGWTLITTALSTNRLLSVQSTITVAAAVILYLATRRLAPQTSWMLLDCCLAAAVINAGLMLLQEYGIWNPFHFPETFVGHLQSTALVGNPDDVGAYLLVPAIATIVGTAVLRGVRQRLYGVVALVLLAGIGATLSRGAWIAVVGGALAFALSRPWKQSLAVLAVVAAVVAIALTAVPRVRDRALSVQRAAREQRYDELFAERLVPFLTAIDMIRSHPMTGVGPGGFKYHYMDERLAVGRYYPAAWTRSWPQNFAETHNDHLQVAAETGFPGYALLLAALLVVGKSGTRSIEAHDRRHFAQSLRIPLVTAFFLVALVEFPLQIAAPRMMFLTFAAIVIGWDAADA